MTLLLLIVAFSKGNSDDTNININNITIILTLLSITQIITPLILALTSYKHNNTFLLVQSFPVSLYLSFLVSG